MGSETALEVFLSSAQHEFEGTRKTLAKRIGRIPFLRCTPLEEAGADPESTRSASLRGVREADIYVGVFGRTYSETTIAEYREAVKHRKPCLAYVFKVAGRDQRMRVFVDDELKNDFKYHAFKDEKGLYKQVEADLRRLLLRLLRGGLERIGETKKAVIEIERAPVAVRRDWMTLPSSPGWVPTRAVDALKEADQAYSNGSYLAAAIMARTAIESALREMLARQGAPVSASRMRSFSGLLEAARESNLITSQDVNRIRWVSYVRNEAAHEGRVPTIDQAGQALDAARYLLERWLRGGPPTADTPS
jgi:HEPN domain-containing protein